MCASAGLLSSGGAGFRPMLLSRSAAPAWGHPGDADVACLRPIRKAPTQTAELAILSTLSDPPPLYLVPLPTSVQCSDMHHGARSPIWRSSPWLRPHRRKFLLRLPPPLPAIL